MLPRPLDPLYPAASTPNQRTHIAKPICCIQYRPTAEQQQQQRQRRGGGRIRGAWGGRGRQGAGATHSAL